MPFKSEKQRIYMILNHPAIAEKWKEDAKAEGKPEVEKAPKKPKK